MAIKRTSNAHWEGTGKEGKGNLTTASKVLDQTAYSFLTRFEDEKGTNPEELLAAAHAGCFTMKLAFVLQAANFVPNSLDTRCTIVMDNGSITESQLHVVASIDQISDEEFASFVKEAEENCPVSKLFKAEITASYELKA